jgi:hypothetical protein
LIDDKPDTTLVANDRWLAYSDGLFETIALWPGHSLALDHHLNHPDQAMARRERPRKNMFEGITLDRAEHAVAAKFAALPRHGGLIA